MSLWNTKGKFEWQESMGNECGETDLGKSKPEM